MMVGEGAFSQPAGEHHGADPEPDARLIPSRCLALLGEAATIAGGDDPRRQAQLRDSIERLARPLLIVQDLPQDASDALGGSSDALDRLTTALAIMGGLADTERGLPSEVDGRLEPLGDGKPPTRPNSLVDVEQIGVVGLGTAYASVARPEAADLIERGLARTLEGLMPLDLAWALTPSVLDGDRRTVRLFSAVLDRLSDYVKPVGPGDPVLPPLLEILKFVPFDRREWLERVGCVVDAFHQVGHLRPLVDPYVITSVGPAGTCPGQSVTISGSDFGSQPQTVRFPTLSGPVDAQVSSWSGGQIQVVVPADAICGDVQLVIPAGTTTGCGNRTVDVYKPGSGSPRFDGGITHISRFTGNGASAQLRVDPKATINFVWDVCPSTASVKLTVTERESGTVLTTMAGLGATGSFSLSLRAYFFRTTLDCVLEALGPCPPSQVTQKLVVLVAPKPNVKIEGMEVTQGIQRFWRQNITENSVSTVAGKDTIVRVYVSADMGGFMNDAVPGIIGVLSVGSMDLYPINGITPNNPTGGLPWHVARHRTAIDRDNINHTLNFRIPASLCWGTKNLFCYLIVPGPGGTVDQTVGFSLTWTWDAEIALKVRWVRITDNHDPATVPPTTPTHAQALETVRRALDHLPYPATDLAAAPLPGHSTTRDFTIDAQGAAMRMDIDNLRSAAEVLGQYGIVAFDAEERWIGLTVPWFRGWGNPKTCVAPIYPAGSTNRERLRAGHELGHTLGRCHLHDTSCFQGAGLTAEPTLDDVAFDPHWNRTIAATGHDFMSYTSPDDNWITTLNWDALRGVP
ncbi:MAG: hypothetical protein ACRDHO_01390 [Actinomycetota bacterium]